MHPILEYMKNYSTSINKTIYQHSSTQEITCLLSSMSFYSLHEGLDMEAACKLAERTCKEAGTDIFKYCDAFAKYLMKDDGVSYTQAIQRAVGCYQEAFQTEDWSRTKQSYRFDGDMLGELINTNSDFKIPHDAFKRLPYRTMYVDYSANPQVCEKIGADGILISVVPFVSDDMDGEHEFYNIMMLGVRDNDVKFMLANILENPEGTQEKSVSDFMDIQTLGNPQQRRYEKSVIADEETRRNFMAAYINTLLYLSSYEPDIRETPASKMQYKDARNRQKTGKNVVMPVREFKVGERFGEAFRKWTKGMLNQSQRTSPTGRHNKPHIRRAHWHRYWMGKNGEEKRLVIKWVHECFCGMKAHEADKKLDTVSHEVRKDNKKRKSGKSGDIEI